MFVNINPEPASAYESLCSLKFAAKVNGCETAAKGGAKRNLLTGGGDAGGGADAGAEAKRLSLPGFPKLAGMPEAAAKRMSMMVGGGAGGAKRMAPPMPPLSGIPPPATKKPKQDR